MDVIKNIALVAHDHKKHDLAEWVDFNRKTLLKHSIVCTGTTGKLIAEVLRKEEKDFNIIKLRSGPLGGDQQLGAMIIDGKIDIIVFFRDPCNPNHMMLM